jgi:hypothetical protein
MREKERRATRKDKEEAPITGRTQERRGGHMKKEGEGQEGDKKR